MLMMITSELNPFLPPPPPTSILPSYDYRPGYLGTFQFATFATLAECRSDLDDGMDVACLADICELI